MTRPREDDDVEDLLDDLPYLWEAQGPAGRNRGNKALEELLWRWEFLPYDWWEMPEHERDQQIRAISVEQAVGSVAIEAERRDYDHDLLLDKDW